MEFPPGVYHLNVGGARIDVSHLTLNALSDTLIGQAIAPKNASIAVKDRDGNYFFDYDHQTIEAVINAVGLSGLAAELHMHRPKRRPLAEKNSDKCY